MVAKEESERPYPSSNRHEVRHPSASSWVLAAMAEAPSNWPRVIDIGGAYYPFSLPSTLSPRGSLITSPCSRSSEIGIEERPVPLIARSAS